MGRTCRGILLSESPPWKCRKPGPQQARASWSALVSAGGVDHAGTDGDAGRLVDQDERTRGAVLRVGVAQQRDGRAQLHTADLVEPELLGVLVAVQGVDVEAVLDVLDQRP